MVSQQDRAEEQSTAEAQCTLHTGKEDSPTSTSLYAVCNNEVAQEDAFAWAARLSEEVSPNHMLVEASIPVTSPSQNVLLPPGTGKRNPRTSLSATCKNALS